MDLYCSHCYQPLTLSMLGYCRLICYVLPRDYTPGYISLNEPCTELSTDSHAYSSTTTTTYNVAYATPVSIADNSVATYNHSDFDIFQTEPPVFTTATLAHDSFATMKLGGNTTGKSLFV
jgi:hypothetical protein